MLGPIFIREGLTAPRRGRHYLARTLFLGTLWVLLLTIWQTTVGWDRPPTLGDQARFGLLAFQVLVTVQLSLMLFFAALSAAGTIAQEKDRRTFVLLLLTDLRNYEIVLGKVLGSLLPIGMLLFGTVPVLMLLMLLGGVAPFQIGQAMAVLAGATVAAGSLGGLIALWRDKTFQALALTVLFLVLYLCVTRALALLTFVGVASETVTYWQTAFDPFVALGQVVDPPLSTIGILAPAYRFLLAMFAVSLGLNLLGIARLRVWNPSSEPIIQPDTEDHADRPTVHAAPGRVRTVWNNPILWREVMTRAYGRRPLLIKLAYFIAVGLICWYAFGVVESRNWAAARGLVPIVILSLLLVSAQAVTAVTSERDLGSFDLLMVTDLSPREFVFGKIGGILYNAKEYLLPPLLLVILYAIRGQLATPPTAYRNVESAGSLLIAALVLMSFTVVLGIHVALRADTSRLAIAQSLGTIFFLSVGTLLCIYLILINGRFEYQWLSFSAFIFLGVGGLWYVLCGDKPSAALTVASWACPFAVFYTVTNLLIGRPGGVESSDPMLPLLMTSGAFGFALAAMLVPLLSEFDVAIGRTSVGGD
jgi:ABC-type Na+ efflux pump permease subunit